MLKTPNLRWGRQNNVPKPRILEAIIVVVPLLELLHLAGCSHDACDT